MVLKSRMVGEGLESVARNSHYIGQVIMVLKCRIVGECVEWVTRQSEIKVGF